MAARRLIVVMLVLLFVSSLATALAPVETGDEQTSSTEPTATPLDPAAEDELVRAEIDAGANRVRKVKTGLGDQLELLVKSPRVATVELVGLGPTDDVGPGTPARFDLLLDDVGEFPVQILENERRIGTIVVEATKAPKEPAPAPAPARP